MLKRLLEHLQTNSRPALLGRFTIWLAFLLACFLVVENIAFAEIGARHKFPDIFSREDIRIEPSQTIGMLLVAGGNATVGGVVEKGIVVVDGNLFLTPDALVKGTVVVLGGYVNSKAGARLEKPMVTLAPIKVPVAGFLVLGLLLLGVSSFVVFPMTLWLAVQIASRTQPYLWLKKQLIWLGRRWPALSIACVLSVGVLMMIFFAEMVYETLIRHQMDVFDNVLVWLVRYLANPELDRAMILISEYGYGYPFWTIIIVVLLALVVRRHWLEAAGFLLCLAGEAILNLGLKTLFERSRPELFQVVAEAGYSFPSGHAMMSICLYGMVVFLITRHIRSWQWRLVVIIFALVLVATIGVSRVYLGVHYPTDVVAGFFAGGSWLALCISLLMWWERRRLEKIKIISR
jgi:undecaprenyl-diphosphatase